MSSTGRIEGMNIEAQELLAQYQRKQKDAAKEAEEIVIKAKEHADGLVKQAKKDIKDTAQRREQQLQERLKRMEESAIQEIQAHAAALAVKATREIIADKMDDATNDKLVDDSIKELAGQLK